ncbi:MAG: glutathione S-transferase family protein [Acidobacteriota bacterium]|nr:MAG: glutathione S-transferase family protein [Acidobacteriota bacterium]
MEQLVLTIGSRNYSSWSLRAWLVIEQTGAPFTEDLIWLDEDQNRAERLKRGPTGRVPVLRHGDVVVWDSLAIAEYLAELFPAAGLWPADRVARARARSVSAEMHSGFFAIREKMPLNCRARKAFIDRGADVAQEIRRVIALWNEARGRFGSGGPFLFGARSIADAFYAPVVCRFDTYGVALDGVAAEYAAAVRAMPAMRTWLEKAAAETHSEPEYDDVP